MASNGGLDSWNPMQDDHLDQEFNMYDRGPGKDMPKRGADRYGGVTLYVTGIPNEFTEEGLMNTFSKVGKCVEVKKMKSKVEGLGYTYGFVKMATVTDCEKAIREYHEFSIGNFKLRVKFARTDEERNRQAKQKQEEAEFLSSLGSHRRSNTHSKASSGSESDGGSHIMSRSGEKIMFGGKKRFDDGPPTLQQAPLKRPGEQIKGDDEEAPGALAQVSPAVSCGRSEASTTIDPSLFHSPGGSQLSMRFHSMGRGRDISPKQNGGGLLGIGPQDFYPPDQHPGYAGDAPMRITSNGDHRYVQGRNEMGGHFRGNFRGRGNMGYNNMGRGNMGFNSMGRENMGFNTMGRGNMGFNTMGRENMGFNNRGRGYMTHDGMGRGYIGRGRGNMEYGRGGYGYGHYDMNYQQPWGYRNNMEGPYQGGYREEERWHMNNPYQKQGYRGGRGRSPRGGRGGQTVKPASEITARPCARCKTTGSLQCSRCKTPYCSHECQKEHWPEHRPHCVDIAKKLEEDEFESRFEVDIGDDAASKEMKAYARTIVQDQYSKQSAQQMSPQVSQPTNGRSQVSPGVRRDQTRSQGVRPQSTQASPGVRQSQPSPQQSSKVSSVPSKSSPAPSSSVPPSRVRSSPPTESQRLNSSWVAKITMKQLEVGQESQLVLVDIDDPGRIIFQFPVMEDMQALQDNDARMKEVLDRDHTSVSAPAVGEFYAGQFVDGSWYRCRVDACDLDRNVTVTYIDYGNKEMVSCSKLRKLRPEWCSLPGQAVIVALDGVGPQMDSQFWSQQAVDRVKELLPPTQMSMKMYQVTCTARDGDRTLVKVLDANGQDVGETLINSGLAAKTTPQTKTTLQTRGPQFIDVDAKELASLCEGWTVGERYLVLITEREGPQNLHAQGLPAIDMFAQFFNEVQEECSAMQMELYRPKRVGELVYGLYDNNWYRAEVLSLSGQAAKVFFIDYGNCELVPFKNLRQATSLCQKQPVFCVPCQQVGLDAGTANDKVEEIFNQLTYKDNPRELSLVYKGRKEGKAVVDFLSDQGELVSVLIPKIATPTRVMAGDIESLTFPEDGSPASCVMMSINSMASFYVYRGTDLEKVMKEVAEICAKDQSAYDPTVGEMVLGQFSEDKSWYRAKVLDVSGDEVMLLYTDFGNKEKVGKDAIRRFDPALSKYPHQSVHCKMASVTKSMETPDLLQVFASLYNQPVQIKLKGSNNTDPVEVEVVMEDGSSVNQTIVELFPDEATSAASSTNQAAASATSSAASSSGTAATSPVTTGSTSTVSRLQFQKAAVPLDGSQLQCSIIEFTSLNSFHLQIIRKGEIEALMTQLEKVGEDKTPYQPEVGDDVCAIYSLDSLWYRARVLKQLDGNSYLVYFVDFGNSENVAVSEIRKLKPEYVKLPCLAVHCRLSAPGPLSEDLNPKFGELAMGGTLSFQAVSQEDDMYSVKMFRDDGVCINDALLGTSSFSTPPPVAAASTNAGEVAKSQAAAKSEPVAAGKRKIPEFDMPMDGRKLPFLITNIFSLGSFHAHYYTEESRERFTAFLEQISVYCAGIPEPYSPAVGEEVCCQFSATEQWLRAQVLQVEGDTYDVQFVDYGNIVKVQKEEIRKLDDSFTLMPKQAIHCSLSSSIDLNSPNLTEKFEEMVRNSISFIVAVKKESDLYEVKISTEEVEDITERLRELPAGFVPRVLTVNGPREPCVFVDMDSFSSFYVQLVGPPYKEALTDLETKLETFCQTPYIPYKARDNELVLTKFAVDGKWYRARVLEVMDESVYRVLFIDFGNKDLVEGGVLREIDPTFLSVPNSGIHCKLAGLGESEPVAALQRFAELTANNLLQMEVVAVEGELHEVVLFNQDGENINEQVLQTIQQCELSTGSPSLEQNTQEAVPIKDTPQCAVTPTATEVGAGSDSAPMVQSSNIRLRDMAHVIPPREEFSVVITSIDSPNEFFCQMADQQAFASLALMMESMMLYCETEPSDPGQKYIVGDMCCAFYNCSSSDGGWYRSVVTETFPNGSYNVQYVDFGNRAILPGEQLRPMKPDFTELPILAFKSALHGVIAPQGSWSNAASEKLGQFLNQPLDACLRDRRGDTLVLQLTQKVQEEAGVREVDVGEYLVNAGVAESESNTADEAALIQQQIAALQAKLKQLNPQT